jgi:hypothetical protein
MSQPKHLSAVEAVVNTIVGWSVAFGAQLIVFPWMGIHVSLHDNAVIGTIFTIISLIRSYIVRRMFNAIRP